MPSTSDLGTKVYAVYRADGAIPQTSQDPIFTVSGNVLVTNIVGTVGTVIQTQSCITKLTANPTTGADVDLCTALNITGDASGTMYSITGTLADALVENTSGAFTAQAQGVVVADGTIDYGTTASNTGTIQWSLHYIPLTAGAYVVAA